MAFFDNLFSAFTGDPAKEAAAKERAALQGATTMAQGQLGAGFGGAGTALTGGYAAGIPTLQQGYGAATAPIGPAYDAARNFLATGAGQAQDYLGRAAGAYEPLSALGQKYGGATTLALGALGVGTPAQRARARAAYTASPGYDWRLRQGIEAATRGATIGGGGIGGNALAELQQRGEGLANQDYQTWLNNLLGFTSPELSATAGAAGGTANVLGQQADVARGLGTAEAGLETDRARMLSDLARQEGIGVAGLQTEQGGKLADLLSRQGIAQAGTTAQFAQPYAATYGNEAAAQMQGSANLWNLAMGLAGLGTNLAGGARPRPIG